MTSTIQIQLIVDLSEAEQPADFISNVTAAITAAVAGTPGVVGTPLVTEVLHDANQPEQGLPE